MAGGDNGTGGNGSVYWKATHYGQEQKKRKMKVKTGGRHGNDEIDLEQDDALGRDEATLVTQVGSRLGHTGFFLVTLRYSTFELAQQAGEWVAANVRPGPGGYLLSVKVPVINRSQPRDDPPFEVTVEW